MLTMRFQLELDGKVKLTKKLNFFIVIVNLIKSKFLLRAHLEANKICRSFTNCTYLYSPGPLRIPSLLLSRLPWLNIFTYQARIQDFEMGGEFL